MNKETSADVAAIAADLVNIRGEDLCALNQFAAADMAEKVKAVAGSALSQAEKEDGRTIGTVRMVFDADTSALDTKIAAAAERLEALQAAAKEAGIDLTGSTDL